MKAFRLHYLLLFLISFLSVPVFGQYYNLYDDNFESNLGWTFENGANNNHFIIGECATNSFPSSGNAALYVAPMTGVGTDCSLGSQLSYAYKPSASGKDTIMAYQTINYTGCGENLVVTFDYRFAPNDANDVASIVYRLNTTSPWITLSALGVSNSWSGGSYALPTSLNSQNFQIGFRFSFDDNTVAGLPIAVDKFVVKGLDFVKPTITCPATYAAIYGDSSCSTVLFDLKGLVTVNDNCTPIANLSISQSPDIGEAISNNAVITFTVKDAASNQETCMMTIELIDTIKPIVNCNYSTTITTNNSSCDYTLPDLEDQIVTITDNCSTSSFVISQNPAIGTAITGAQNVTIFVEDEQGNIGTCIVKTIPTDTIDPTIVCPSDKTISNGTSCDFTLLDYTLEATVADNCNLLPTNQYPSAGDIVHAGTNIITLKVRDESGNNAECSFNIHVIETEVPVFTACPTNISTCDSLITFPNLTATDNCDYGIFKADNTGLNSGDIFPVGTTNLKYEARDSSGNIATCAFTVTVFPSPETPTFIESPVEVCNQTSATIAVVPLTSGTGQWTLPSGSTLTIANPTQESTTVSGLATGDNIVIWKTSTQHCGDTSSTLIIKNYALPSQASIANDTSYKCNPGTIILSSQLPLVGTGKWTCDNPTVTIVNSTNHNATINTLDGGWYTFYYTVSNGTCPSTSDSIKLFRMAAPEILNFPDDTTICEKVTLDLIGSAPYEGVNAAWYFEQGNGSFTDESNPSTQLTDYKLGTNVIIYSFSSPYCGVVNDTLVLTYNNCDGKEFVIPTLITPNQDGKNDMFVIDGLNIKYPDCKVTIINRWGSVVFESEGYSQPWEGTHKGKALPVGTYYYVIDLNNGSGELLRGPISIIR